jgi:hypothetical protein
MDPIEANQQRLLETLDGLADRARHPSLELDRFTDDGDDEVDKLSDDQRLRACRRRAAVIHAANLIVDELIDETRAVEWEPGTGVATPGGGVEDSFVWRALPPRFRAAYDEVFFAKVLVTAVKVAYDLARPDGQDPACLAEELLINAVCTAAEQIMEDAGLGHGWLELTEILLEDLDFMDLYDAGLDGAEQDPATQRGFDKWVPGTADWFTPFRSSRVVHPYVETVESGPQAHDLMLRVQGDDELFARIRDPQIADDPRYLSGLDPVSDAVAQARSDAAAIASRAPAPNNADQRTWVADASVPESSFDDLVTLVEAVGNAGSGWLTWEPHEGADAVRTDAVVVFQPHRHFPIGADQAWVDVSFGGMMMAIPLSAVVSYRPDA